MSGPRAVSAVEAARDARRGMAKARTALRAAAQAAEDPVERGLLHGLAWLCSTDLDGRERFFSQHGQDAWLDAEVFGARRGGVFVDVGAFDGATGSNTLFFELFRGWTGLVVEAVPRHAAAARELRRVPCETAVVGDGAPAEFLTVEAGPVQMSGLTATYAPRKRDWAETHPGAETRTVTTATLRLEDLMDRHDLARADLVSLDVEGAELLILQGFPFARIDVRCWCVETGAARDEIVALMASHGYAWRERLGDDDVFLRDGSG